jgi:peptidoglycan/xylan/chitin deacetylase (PgdA/CDA1 family)
LLRPLIPASTYLRLMPDTLICPVYHIARETTPVWWNNRYRIKSIRELEQDLDWLLRLAPPVSLQDLLDWQAGRRDRPRGWFLSFDDGYRELADEVAPLLKRKGIPATFFLCSSLIDNRSVFFEDHTGWIAHALLLASPAARNAVSEILDNAGTPLVQLLKSRVPHQQLLDRVSELLNLDINAWLKSEEPYLTSAQIRQLLHDGFTIGAHSVDHPLFSDISLDECMRQIQESLLDLDAAFALNARVFAFPYGEFGLSATALQQLLQLSNAQMVFGTRGIVRDEHEPQLIQRLLAEDHPFSFQQHLCSELNLQLQRRLAGRSTVRRSLVPQ